MSKIFSIIGGDNRNVKLVDLLVKDGNIVNTYALEKSKEIFENDKIIKSKTIEEAIKETEIVIGPIPFSKDNNYINSSFSDEKISINEIIANLSKKTFITGSIQDEIYNQFEKNKIKFIDIMKNEEFAILNSIATAEGTISIIIDNTERNLQEMNILILGYGRIGKMLARKLHALSVNITCCTKDLEELAWIQAFGYKSIELKHIEQPMNESIKKILKKQDVIINTIPKIILKKEQFENIKKECLIIDLASRPGGIDYTQVQKKEIKCIVAPGLPGKISPLTSAKIIKDIIYKNL